MSHDTIVSETTLVQRPLLALEAKLRTLNGWRKVTPRTAPRVALPMALILFQNIDDSGYDLRL